MSGYFLNSQHTGLCDIDELSLTQFRMEPIMTENVSQKLPMLLGAQVAEN
ncbi:hypothetical protein BH18THE2_BH18THE2_10630 [soil metagenome]